MISGMRSTMQGARRSASSETVANVLATDLEGHYTFESLTDHSGNGRDLTGTGTFSKVDAGYRLGVSGGTGETARLISEFTAFTFNGGTLQIVAVPRTLETYNSFMRIQAEDYAIQPEPRMQIGTRSPNNTIGYVVTLDSGNQDHTDGISTLVADQAVMLTLKAQVQSGSDIFVRQNKTEVHTDGVSGTTFSPDEVVFAAENSGVHDIVYAVWYSSFLSDADCDANYDAIKSVVNTRSGVALP